MKLKLMWGDEGRAKHAMALLGQIPGAQIEPCFVADFLEGKVAMPFVELEDGTRYYGLDSIREYAAAEDAPAQPDK